MRGAFVAFLVLFTDSTCAGDLEALKAAAKRYVAEMKSVLTTSGDLDCAEMVGQACEYAAAKSAYYDAARKAMPSLLQMAKGRNDGSRYGEELAEIFQGFGEDRDEEATGILTNALQHCPASVQREQALKAIEQAEETAKKFVEEFGGLEGVEHGDLRMARLLVAGTHLSAGALCPKK